MSGTQFPSNPSDGQTFTTAGATWRYNAATQTWVNANTGGSFVATDNGVANQPTINQPVVMGVTDGSDAAAGAVGETISVTSVGPTASINVPPGRWLLTAVASGQVSGSVGTLYLNYLVNGVPMLSSIPAQSGGGGYVVTLTLPAIPTSQAAAFTAAATTASSSNVNMVFVYIYARRIG